MKKYLILISLFFFQVSYALEAEYKTFGGRTISDGSSLGDYIAYYFNFGLVFAAGAAVLIMIFAGINYLISGDNFSKRLIAKKMIFNSLFGLLLALGSVLILNTINPDSETFVPELESGKYSEGINLVNGDNKTWVNDNMSKVTQEYASIEWLSPAEDLPAVYVFSAPDYTGPSQEVKNGSSVSIPINASIWFLWSKPGSYILYNGTDFSKGDKNLPLSSTQDKTALAIDFFNNSAKSIKINQDKDDASISYGAILFSEARYEGSCVWTFSDISNLSEDKDPENHPAIGLDETSSIKRIVGSSTGAQITIFNRANCQYFDDDKGTRKCTINTIKTNIDIAEECKTQGERADFTNEEVLSINFDSDNAGVLLVSNNNTCQYFEKTGPNKCISLIKYGNIYDPDNKILPKYLTLFSLNK